MRDDNINLGKIEPKPTPTSTPGVDPNKSRFQSEMEKPSTSPGTPQAPEGVSPMDLPRDLHIQTTGPSIESLLAQANSADGDLSDIRKKLDTPNLKFKRQHQYLLRNKLLEANNHLRAAGNRMGANMPDPAAIPHDANPIEKFIGYVTDGQHQMMAAKAKLQEIGADNKKLNPSELLLVQIKMSQAQQNLEYSSILLSKVIDIFKQTLNIQL